MRLVKNEKKYWEFIRKVRTHPANTGGFIEQGLINPRQQREYMKKHNDEYYICLELPSSPGLSNPPAGFIGVVNNDIRLAVASGYKGRGIGTFMVEEIAKIFPDARAKVKVENTISNKLFKKAGFELTGVIEIGAESFNTYINGNV